VVTDFGLAFRGTGTKTEHSGSGTWHQVSVAGNLYGTPAYMAPEQIEGEAGSVASDIYALGLVIYEMVTGVRPFSGATPMSAAAKRLVEAPPSPRKFDPAFNSVWESVILRCLEREPSKRFAETQDVANALDSCVGQPSGAPYREISAPRFAHRGRGIRIIVLPLLALVLLAGLVIAYQLHTRVRRSSLSSLPRGVVSGGVKMRPAVAVLGFKNLSRNANSEWLSTAFSETLTTELAAGEKIRTIPGEKVAHARTDLSLPDEESFTQDTLARIHDNLGTDFVVFGSYLDMGKESGGRVRLDVRLQDARVGETLASMSETGTEAQLFDLILRTGEALRGKLGVGEVSVTDAEAVRASTPQNQEVARLYAEGLKRLWVFDALGARDLLEKAVAAEPSYVLSHDALAQTWLTLGYETKAAAEARKAVDLSGNLSREERLSIEGRYRETTHEWQKAIELYGALFQFYPDNLDYGLRKAKVQRAGGKAKDALATIQALRTLPPPARDDPRIDIAESEIASALGDFNRAQSLTAGAAERASAAGEPFLLASAKLDQCWALQKLGQYQQSLASCEVASRTYAQAGDHDEEARAKLDSGAALQEAGDFAGAAKAHQQALAAFQQVGDKQGIASTLNNMAVALSAEGEHFAAEKKYEQALAIVQEIGSKSSSASVVGNIAGELRLLGNLAQASRKYNEAVVMNRELGNQGSEAWALKGLGATLYLQGELREAEKALNGSIEICRKTNVKRTRGFVLESLADLLESKGRLDQARAYYEEALSIWTEIGNQGDMAESRMQLAALTIEEGRAAEAESAVRRARQVFQQVKWSEDEIRANVVLARALLAEGKPAEALKELDLAGGKKLENEDIRLRLILTSALVRASSGTLADLSAAEKILDAMLKEAKDRGFAGYVFEARLALGQIEMKSGHAIYGRARLTALDKDARGKGFVLIADKATMAAKI